MLAVENYPLSLGLQPEQTALEPWQVLLQHFADWLVASNLARPFHSQFAGLDRELTAPDGLPQA